MTIVSHAEVPKSLTAQQTAMDIETRRPQFSNRPSPHFEPISNSPPPSAGEGLGVGVFGFSDRLLWVSLLTVAVTACSSEQPPPRNAPPAQFKLSDGRSDARGTANRREGPEREVDPAKKLPASVYVDIDVKGLSGVAYHPLRGTIFVVSDRGYVVELDAQLRRLVRYEIDGDLEGIAVDGGTGNLYLASEREGAILEYAIETNRVVRTMVVDFDSHAALRYKGDGNRGLEGVAIVPQDGADWRLFAVVQSDPARLLELRRIAEGADQLTEKLKKRIRDRLDSDARWLGKVERWAVSHVFDLGIDPLSDVTHDPSQETLIVTSSAKRLALVCTLKGAERRRFRLPGKNPEGLALLPGGEILTVDDKGGLSRLPRTRVETP